jgi:hypothetical protein
MEDIRGYLIVQTPSYFLRRSKVPAVVVKNASFSLISNSSQLVMVALSSHTRSLQMLATVELVLIPHCTFSVQLPHKFSFSVVILLGEEARMDTENFHVPVEPKAIYTAHMNNPSSTALA